DAGRISYAAASDAEALEAFHILAALEGIVPALESAHAVAHLLKVGATYAPRGPVIVNVSGRGDKDVDQVAALERG
ncbi:MAG TPA: tryptophan synthase subunit beta, partial [Verrucomicrobiae bacterium]|nr:tryptophan synthase subunit beta [Verrucomicrobiae bacterium]